MSLDMGHKRNESKDEVFTESQIESLASDENISEGSINGGVVLKKGPWTPAEDEILIEYVKKHGEGNWNAVQKHSGLSRCGKSCRLRWANHLRPNLKKGAFTDEEERLICEFHAKWGNKWARMAARLPGRTDNEIKNFWNTRIKRCQKSGTPLYPPDLCVKELQDCQQGLNNGGNMSLDTGHHDMLQANNYELPDVVFDNLNNQDILQYVPELPDVSLGMRSLGYSQHFSLRLPTVHQQKRLKGTGGCYPDYICCAGNEFFSYGQFLEDSLENSALSFYYSLPRVPDPPIKSSLSYRDVQGSQSLSTGNSSASKPVPVAVKLELPSLQYSDTDINSWVGSSTSPPLLDSVDSFINSPKADTWEPECGTPCNSGLLDAVLYESKCRNSSKNNSSDKSTNSSTVTHSGIGDTLAMNVESEMEDHSGPLSPLGNSATSLFNEYTPVSAAGSSLEDQLPAEAFTVYSVKTEPDDCGSADDDKETSAQIDSTWPDSLLAIDYWSGDLDGTTEQTSTSDTVQTFGGNDLGNDCKHYTASQASGLGSCSWNNVSAVP